MRSADQAPARQAGQVSDLFGRGLLYVVIWSMQLVVATLVSPVLAHSLPAEQFGRLAAAIALYQLLMVVSVVGIDQAVEVQRVEDGPDPRPARGLVAAGMVIASTVVALTAATARWWAPALGFQSADLLIWITLLWTAPGAAVLLMLSLLQAEDRLRHFAWVSLFSTVGGLVLGLVLMFTVERSAVGYAWGGVIGQLVALVLGLWWVRPRLRGVADGATVRRAVALGLPIVAASLCQFVLTAADRFLIQRVLGEVEVARYQVAFTVGNAMALLLTFTSKAWLPRLKAISDEDLRWREASRARTGTVWLLAWAFLGVSVSAPVLLRIFAPISYDLASLVPVVVAVGLGALPLAVTAACTQILVTERRSRPLAVGAVVAVGVKIALSLAGIRWAGLLGTALATTTAVAAQAVVLSVVVARRHRRVEPALVIAAVVAGAIAAAVASTWLPQSGWWLIARFVVSLACFVPFVAGWLALRHGRLPWRQRA